MKNIKILLADDHGVVRQGIKRILTQEEDIEVVAEANDGEEAVQLAERYKPDVVLIDISMPKLDGIEATKRIKASNSDIAVLVLSAYDEDQFIFSALEAGAAGYLLKSIDGQDLVNAVRSVFAGESVLHPSITRKVLSRFSATQGKVAKEEAEDLLSKRELDVLKLMARGLSNKEIADELYLNTRTVQGHVGNIFNKLQVKSRTEAVVYALKKGLVTLDDSIQ